MRKLYSVVLAAFVSVMGAMAQESVAMDWLRASRNPAAAALAGAGSASAGQGTAFAFLQNPALAPLQQEKLGAGVSMALSPSGDATSNNLAAGVSYRLGKLSVHAGYASTRYPETAFSSEGGGAAGTFVPTDMALGGGFGYAFTESLSLGANVRYAMQQLSSKVSISSVNADVAALYRLGNLSLSAGAYCLGPKVKRSSGNSEYALPSSAKIGASYVLEFGDSVLDIVADADYYFNSNLGFAAGAAYSLKDMFFARAGFAYGSSRDTFIVAPVPTHFALGAGVKLYGVRVDLCAKVVPNAGTVFCGGISYAL